MSSYRKKKLALPICYRNPLVPIILIQLCCLQTSLPLATVSDIFTTLLSPLCCSEMTQHVVNKSTTLQICVWTVEFNATRVAFEERSDKKAASMKAAVVLFFMSSTFSAQSERPRYRSLFEKGKTTHLLTMCLSFLPAISSGWWYWCDKLFAIFKMVEFIMKAIAHSQIWGFCLCVFAKY